MGAPILEVCSLRVDVTTSAGTFSPVRDISFSVPHGGRLAIVGESGSGKSLTLRSILKLLPKHLSPHGEILFEGRNLLSLRERELAPVRGRKIAMIFQDPSAALNPIQRVGSQVAEVARLSGVRGRHAVTERVHELLRSAGLSDTERVARSYPHELSGGMKQRVLIAIALACDPDVILCDEPTTALDVTIQEAILKTLREKCEERRMTLVFVTHDLAVARQLCDEILVMYAGREMESGPIDDVFTDPRNAYTLSLLGAVPELTGPRRALVTIPGEPPTPRTVLAGCPFVERCQLAQPSCAQALPPLLEVSPQHRAACVHAADGFSQGAPSASPTADGESPLLVRDGVAVEGVRER